MVWRTLRSKNQSSNCLAQFYVIRDREIYRWRTNKIVMWGRVSYCISYHYNSSVAYFIEFLFYSHATIIIARTIVTNKYCYRTYGFNYPTIWMTTNFHWNWFWIRSTFCFIYFYEICHITLTQKYSFFLSFPRISSE